MDSHNAMKRARKRFPTEVGVKTFSISSHHRHGYPSATEMATSNREYLRQQAEREKACWIDLQIFDNTQRVVQAFNEAMAGPRNALLNPRFRSRSRILFGSNARAITTFVFADDSRAIALDSDLLYEVVTLIFALSREAEYGSLLAVFILYNNITSANAGFPLIRKIAIKSFEQSPAIFNDILRSCLYLLVFHEVWHEYIDEFGVREAQVTATERSEERRVGKE